MVSFHKADSPCRVLALDGGGAKGFYTLGVLEELEAAIGGPLCGRFDLIFGTSTGAIIAALLGLGYRANAVSELYRTHVTDVMRARSAAAKSEALGNLADKVFKADRFDAFQTGVGLVATRWVSDRPMIFKSSATQAHGRRSSFEPGFGCTISEAVQASCSAFPFFLRKTVVTATGDRVELLDGGYCANNPALYALADATQGLGRARADIRLLTLGVGHYPTPKRRLLDPGVVQNSVKLWLARKFMDVDLLQKTLDINTESMEQLRHVLFPDVDSVRVSDAFTEPEMAADLFEHDFDKLSLLQQRGRQSFGAREADILTLLR